MIGTEEQTMRDETRGRGASFSAAECGTLEAWGKLAAAVLDARAAMGSVRPITPEERDLQDALLAKCERGAGL